MFCNRPIFNTETSKINSVLEKNNRFLAGFPLHQDSQVTVFFSAGQSVGSDIESRLGKPRVIPKQDLFLPKGGSAIQWKVNFSSQDGVGAEHRVNFKNPFWRTQLFGGITVGKKGFEKDPGLVYAKEPVILCVGNEEAPLEFELELVQKGMERLSPITVVRKPYGPLTQKKLDHLMNRTYEVSDLQLEFFLGKEGVKIVNAQTILDWTHGTAIEHGHMVKKDPSFDHVSCILMTDNLSLEERIWLSEHLPGSIPCFVAYPFCKDIPVNSMNKFPLEDLSLKGRTKMIVSENPTETAKQIPGRKVVISPAWDSGQLLLNTQIEFENWTVSQAPTELLNLLQQPDPLVLLGLQPGSQLWKVLEPLFWHQTSIQLNGQSFEIKCPLLVVVHAKHRHEPALAIIPQVDERKSLPKPPIPKLTSIQDIHAALASKGILCLRGEPGVGKTLWAEQLFEKDFQEEILKEGLLLKTQLNNLFLYPSIPTSYSNTEILVGLSQLDDFFKPLAAGTKRVLIIDDLHRIPKGALRFLKGLLQTPPSLIWNGELHPFDPKTHGIILLETIFSKDQKRTHGILSHIPQYALPATESYRTFWQDSIKAGLTFLPIDTLKDSLKMHNILLCPSNVPIFEKIYQFIQIREFKLNFQTHTLTSKNTAYLGKNGLRIIGASGNGKSTAAKTILLALGYKHLQIDQDVRNLGSPFNRYFYHTTAQSLNFVHQVLEKALYEGVTVLLDEGNMMSMVQYEPYLEGKFPETSIYYGKTPKPGCVIIFTGNDPQGFEGRTEAPQKVKDLTEEIVWEGAYTREDFDIILADALGNKEQASEPLKTAITRYLKGANEGNEVNARPIFEQIVGSLFPQKMVK